MKSVLITGANGNLGLTVTREFLNKGYHVIASIGNDSGKKDFKPDINLDVQTVDLSNENQTYSFVHSTIEKYGKVDAAILLVGGFATGGIDSTGGDDLRKQISLNFETAYYVARPIFSHMMLQNSGKIIFIGARPSLVPSQGSKLLAYSLSKTLLFKLAEFLNEEAKGKNISVSVIVPSIIDTPLNRKNMPQANPENWVNSQQIAETMEFLISSKGAALRETVLKIYNNS